MKKNWNVHSKKTVFDNRWQRVDTWRVQVPDGSTHDFSFNVRNDFIFVFVVTSDKKVLMLRQYHLNIEQKHWTLVAGYVDAGETPRQAVKRELLEETGHKAGKITPLGWGVCGKWVIGTGHYYVVQGATKVQDPQREPAEDIDMELVSFAEVRKLLKQHVLVDSLAEACTLRALTYLKKV